MNIISNLLKLSNDLILVTDKNGNIREVGEKFRQVLERGNTGIAVIESMVRHNFPLHLEDGMPLHLDRFNIQATPFFMVHQDQEKIVFMAGDLSQQKEIMELQEKDKRLHIMLDESSDPIFGFRKDGTYIYVNNIFAGTLGYSKEEIIGKKLWDIFPKEEADKRYAMVRKTFDTGETDNIEVHIPLPEGDKYFLTTVKPVKSKNGSVDFIICISKDITELRTAQAQLKTLTGVLPICSHCKNIRNDTGAWQQLEAYISHHSEAEFTHGLCPDCAQELYSDLLSRDGKGN